MEPVRSHRNQLVVDAARLHRARHRKERGQTLIEGLNLVSDAISSGCRVESLFALADDEAAAEMAAYNRLRLTTVDDRALARLTATETPRGPVAVAAIPAESLPSDRDVLVSWGVSDPGNVGTLIRTAAAFGWAFAYASGTADPWAPKTLRAGAGGQFQTSIKSIGRLEELSAWKTLASVARGGDDPAGAPATRVALLIGEEASGLPDEVVRSCSSRVSIPMAGPTESLNAAVAAGILVYVLAGRDGHTGTSV